jgi:hypothetical protein
MKNIQKLYDELSQTLVTTKEARKAATIREFCLEHNLPVGQTQKIVGFNITKKLTRALPKLPFVQ